MAEKVRLRLVTPSRLLFDEEVDEVTAPGALGEFTVLPNHIAFLTLLEIGEMSYKRGAERSWLAVGPGYAEVLENVMTVLADAAEYSEEIDVGRARRAKEEAEKKKEGMAPDDKEFPAVDAALRRASVELQVAGKGAKQ